MNSTNHNKVLQYKYQDSLSQAWSSVVANIALFVIFLFSSSFVYRGGFCFVAGLIVALALYKYDWSSKTINLCIISLYLVLFVFELLLCGIPDLLLPLDRGSFIGKGFLLDAFVGILPYLYVGCRLLFVLPLFQLHRHANGFFSQKITTNFLHPH